MPRRKLSIESGSVYHVISRFVGQQYFIPTAEERRTYLCTLGLYLAATNWRCFSFAVMSNHIHLGLLAGSDTLASWMQPAHTKFAQWINEKLERIGAVFVRGPNVIGVRAEGVARLIGYIHNNPVRAAVATSPSASDWTSQRAYLGLAYRPSWLDVELGLELGGFRDANAFGAWMRATVITRADVDADRANPPKTGGRHRQNIGDAAPVRLAAVGHRLPTIPKRAKPAEQLAGFFRSGGDAHATSRHPESSHADELPAGYLR